MTDGLQELVTAYAEAVYNDPGEHPVPMATTDAEEVIKSQLTENTGTHFLDSGGAYGRHWEENQDSPPWDDPAFNVEDGYVVHNVYDWMDRVLGRGRTCVALEAALYAYSYKGPGQDEAWLTCMENFAQDVLEGRLVAPDLTDLGLPTEWVEATLGVQADLRAERGGSDQPFRANTYNSEFHDLTQVLQGTNLGGPYAEYVFLQVHQGCDVRGGYTGPRVYTNHEMWLPSELFFRCEQCGWDEAESCAWDDDRLLYQSSIDPFELEEMGWLPEGDEEHPALSDAHDADGIDGALFHRCEDEPGRFGHVRMM